ncbi:MAG: hypothetical protein QXI68_02055 [Sulfolobales archaeon]
MRSANIRGLDSANDTIVCSDKPTFVMHVVFSIDNIAPEGYIYHDTGPEARGRFSFHRHIKEAVDTIGKIKSKEKRPALTANSDPIYVKCYRYSRTTIKEWVPHRQETMPYPKRGTARTVTC